MKTVPTLRVVSKSDAPAELAELGMTDLPDEVRLALTDIAGAARDGLLAMSVAAGMAVMQAMLEAEVTAACGPKGQHDLERVAVRHGRGAGSVVLGGRRVPVDRPRARTVDGHEVPLAAYNVFAADDLLVGFQNPVTWSGLGFYAARSYSMISPPRTGRRPLVGQVNYRAIGARGLQLQRSVRTPPVVVTGVFAECSA